MRKPTIKTSFWTLTDTEFDLKASTICAFMDGNEYFPNPVPSIATVRQASEQYSAAVLESLSRDKVAIVLKNDLRWKLTELLMQLASSVKTVATDSAMLASSGFDMAGGGTPASINKPRDVQVTDGPNDGDLISKCSIVKGARGYCHQITVHPVTTESVWTEKFSTRSKYMFSNLKSGTKYWIRINVIGSRNQEIMTDAVCRVAQ